MSLDTTSAMAVYNNHLMNVIREELMQGYINLGRIEPEENMEGMTLKRANDNMVDYIINKLDITQDSFVLDQGCGMGMYLTQISKKTGCKYIGTDISTAYLEKGRKTAADLEVDANGHFLCAPWGEMPEEVKKQTFTHVLTLGAMFYGHPILETIFREMAECSDGSTKIFIWDFVRVAEWVDCATMNKHLKLPHSLLTKEEVLEQIEQSPLELAEFEDVTKYIIPGYNILAEECKKRDPDMKTLTNPLVRDAFVEGKLAYVIYNCKLK